MAERTQLYQNTHQQFEGSIGPKRAGRRARFSYLATDDQGKPVRRWHGALPGLTAQEEKSLRGMVKP